MARWAPCKRREFIKKLRGLGFGPPEPGGKHHYMRYGTYTLTLPSNREYSTPQIRMLLNEIERGTGLGITADKWQSL